MHVRSDTHLALWIPTAVVAVGYLIARISPIAELLPVALAVTPLARRTFLRHPLFWEAAALFYLLFFWVDFLVLSRHMGMAITHLLAFLLISRSWVTPFPRHVSQRLGITLALWVVIGAINNDAYYMAVSLLAVPAFLWALMAYPIWRWGMPDEPMGRLGQWVPGMTAFVILVGMGIFLVLPRYPLGFGYNDRFSIQVSARSGFSGQIDLSSVTGLKQDNRVALRVFLRPIPSNPEVLYWRGRVLDHFDGRRWRSTIPGVPKRLSRTYAWKSPAGGQTEGAVWEQEIWPAFPQPVLFHLFSPIQVRVPHGLSLIVHGGLTFPARRVEWYYVRSVWIRHSLGRYAIPAYSNFDTPGTLARYQTLPPRRSPALLILARRWTAGAPTPIQKASAIERYLSTRFRYTTENVNAAYLDPIEAFLTRTRAGHCEYFATAMALMLRTLGIPTRVVVGFRGGQWNPRGQFWQVLNRDAHAWVEVWDAERSLWVAFDPTAPATSTTRLWTHWIGRLRQWQDAIAFWWDRQIVLYSSHQQATLVRRLLETSRRIGQMLERSLGTVISGLVVVFVGFGLVVIGIWWTRRRRGVARTGHFPVDRDFQALLHWVERRLGPRRPGETLLEYMERLRPQAPTLVDELIAVTWMFYRMRFAYDQPSGKDTLRTRCRRIMAKWPNAHRFRQLG